MKLDSDDNRYKEFSLKLRSTYEDHFSNGPCYIIVFGNGR